jgi:two-component system, NarL family, response regulator DevR
MAAESPIRVLLVDDSAVVRIGLKEVLSADPAIEVIGEGTTSDEGLAKAVELQPDVVLLDVRLPEIGGIETCRQLLETMPGVRVLFLSAFADEELVRAAILVGAHGYLLKEIDAALLVESIKRVASGDSILDPTLRQGMLDWVLRNVPAGVADQAAGAALSPQEERIVALVAEGKTNKEIAAILELSPKTVKNYLHNVFEKLGIRRRSQAAVLHARRKFGRGL